MDWHAFEKQQDFLESTARHRCAFAAKRSGKSEALYIDDIMKADEQPGYIDNGRDPYIVAIVAPTDRMLRRLVWPKFRKMAQAFEEDFHKSDHIFYWNTNNTEIMGFTAEKISRMEGFKIHHCHLTEVFQMKEEVIYEVIARISDSGGTLTMDGSLGTKFINPKATWPYKMFVENTYEDTDVFIWNTIDNPHFPKKELTRLKNNLNPKVFRALFEIDWSIASTSRVYEDFDEGNIVESYNYNKALPTYVTIDWGWTHPCACLFIQHNPRTGEVIIFDEIVQSKLKLEDLYSRIMAKGYRIAGWSCDPSGKKEDERPALNNIKWFAQAPRNISFKHRHSFINDGLVLVRNCILNGKGQKKFKVDRIRCPKTLDAVLNYAYPVKNGKLVNEMPEKDTGYDDPCDSFRMFFINFLNKGTKLEMQSFKRPRGLG